MFTIKIHFYFQEIASNSALKKHTFRLLQMAIQESKSKSISRFGSFLFVLSQNQNFLSAFVELSYALSRLRVDCFRILRTAPTVQKVQSMTLLCPLLMQFLESSRKVKVLRHLEPRLRLRD